MPAAVGQRQRQAAMTPPELVAHGGRIVLKLLGRPSLGTGRQFLQGADKGRPGQQRLHRLDVEQRGIIVAMLGIRGGAGQQHQPGPARSQGLDGAVPGAAGGRLLGLQQLGQLLVLLPRLRRLPTELFQQVGPIVADQHGRAHRHGDDLVAPGGLVELQQLEDLAPLAALAAVALAGVALFTVAVVAGVGAGQFFRHGADQSPGRQRADHGRGDNDAVGIERLGGGEVFLGGVDDGEVGAGLGVPFAAEPPGRLGQRRIVGHQKAERYAGQGLCRGRRGRLGIRPWAAGRRQQQAADGEARLRRSGVDFAAAWHTLRGGRAKVHVSGGNGYVTGPTAAPLSLFPGFGYNCGSSF